MIRIDKAVTLLLPFHRYTLRLSHRLLDSLGGVSGFLLRALADGLTLPQLAEVTGLSAGALLKQFSFLEQHYFVSVDCSGEEPAASLTERGVRMVAIQQLLDGFEPTVWLDAFTLKRYAVHFLTSLNPDQLLRIPEEAAFREEVTVRVPERAWSYSPFEQLNRLRSVLDEDALTALLTFFKDGDRAMITDEAAHWEYSLSRLERDDCLSYFPVVFDPEEFCLRQRSDAGASSTLPAIGLPVLGLTQRFQSVAAFPWQVDAPPSSTVYVELVSLKRLSNFTPALEPEAGGRAVAALPAVAAATPPDCLSGSVVPLGVSMTLDVSRRDVLCDLEHAALSRRMHEYDGVLLYSFNHRETEAEPA